MYIRLVKPLKLIKQLQLLTFMTDGAATIAWVGRSLTEEFSNFLHVTGKFQAVHLVAETKLSRRRWYNHHQWHDNSLWVVVYSKSPRLSDLLHILFLQLVILRDLMFSSIWPIYLILGGPWRFFLIGVCLVVFLGISSFLILSTCPIQCRRPIFINLI